VSTVAISCKLWPTNKRPNADGHSVAAGCTIEVLREPQLIMITFATPGLVTWLIVNFGRAHFLGPLQRRAFRDLTWSSHSLRRIRSSQPPPTSALSLIVSTKRCATIHIARYEALASDFMRVGTTMTLSFSFTMRYTPGPCPGGRQR
jgi:hypothetical protein